MPQYATGAPVWTNLIPLLVVGLVILRNARERRIRMERLWIGPATIMILTGFTIAVQPPQGPLAVAIDAAALVLGVTLGWWRGRASRFTINPDTHEVTSKVSPWGMLLILGIFGLRYLLREFLGGEASVLHVSAAELTDAFMVLAVGVVCSQRVEWFLRARGMIAEAKAA
jgi:membrane protein CcdC involved in cytochrome C biogenesis